MSNFTGTWAIVESPDFDYDYQGLAQRLAKRRMINER
jgi:hypothetical protein